MWETNGVLRKIWSGFIFFLNRRGVPVNGIRTSDGSTLKILVHLWEVHGNLWSVLRRYCIPMGPNKTFNPSASVG